MLSEPLVAGASRLARMELKIAAGTDIESDFQVPPEEQPRKTVRGVVLARHAGGPPIAGALLVVVPIDRHQPDAHGARR